MTAYAMASPRLDLGRVVTGALDALKRNWRVFGLVSLVFAGLPGFVIQFLQSLMADNATAVSVLTALDRVSGLALTCIVQPAVIAVLHAEAGGRRLGFSESLSAGTVFARRMFFISILSGLGIILGLVLLVVPGIFLSVIWSMASPAAVIEKIGARKSLSRSALLSRNHRWEITGLSLALSLALLVVCVLIGIVPMAAGAALDVLGVGWGYGFAESLWVGAVLMLIAVVPPTAATVLYTEMRRTKEGVGQEPLASVFD